MFDMAANLDPTHDRADQLRRDADARRLAGRTRLRWRRPTRRQQFT